MEAYTNVWLHKGKIYVKGIKNGRPHKEICSYNPYLFVPSKEETQYKTLWNSPVEKMNFNTIREAKEFVKQYDDVEGFKIYGLSNWQYAYIYDSFPGHINYAPEKISVVALDIENKMTHRVDIATSVSTVPNEITAVTFT